MAVNKICIIAGSKSDLPGMVSGLELLEELEINYEVRILSAHRTPEELASYVQKAEENGAAVFIGVAGKAAHLPGVIAAHTTRPVLGVPVLSSTLAGMDALFSMVQMPAGTPVGVMGINNMENAVIFAARILSVSDCKIKKKLEELRDERKRKIKEDNERITASGWRCLLKEES